MKEKAKITHKELDQIRQGMGYGIRDLALVLNIPLRTVESYFYGDRTIPQGFIDRLEELQRKDAIFMSQIPARVDQALDKQFGPGGMFLSDTTP